LADRREMNYFCQQKLNPKLEVRLSAGGRCDEKQLLGGGSELLFYMSFKCDQA